MELKIRGIEIFSKFAINKIAKFEFQWKLSSCRVYV